MKRIKVVHVITSMLQDGAQHMLLRVVSGLDPEIFDSVIVNLRGPTPLSKEFESRGFVVHSVDMKKHDPLSLLRLLKMRRFVVSQGPDILQGWMEHSNLCATWLAKSCQQKPAVFWNIRRSLYNLKHDKLNTKVILHVCKWLSSSADGIIFCAKEAIEHYRQFGFSLSKIHWIPNGFNLSKFVKKDNAHQHVAGLLGINPESKIIGNIGRYHPNKDHENLLRAAANVISKRSDVHFVLIGRGVNSDNQTLKALAIQLKITANIHLIGSRTDLPEIMPGFDIFCLASRTEGFPNVVGEAMCCEVPCVVTDSGATKELVEGVGTLVPRENMAALADALMMVLGRSEPERREEGIAARKRIEDIYSIESVVNSYRDLYLGVRVRK